MEDDPNNAEPAEPDDMEEGNNMKDNPRTMWSQPRQTKLEITEDRLFGLAFESDV